MMDNPLPSTENRLYQELLRIDKKAGKSYKGALKVLSDLENPDRFSQSANSLREVTNIISRKVSIPQKIKDEVLKEKLEREFVEQPSSLPYPSEKETKALIGRWGHLHEFFTGISHHGKEVTEEEFLDKLSEFEAILLQFLKPVPLTLVDLDSLLNIQSPTEDDVRKLSSLLKHPTHVRYFFERLTSVEWFEILKKHEFFRKPATSVRIGNYVTFPVWPLSKYLTAIADKKPREVMDVIKDMEKTDNPGVYIDLVDCALKMPSNIAKEIITHAKKWIEVPYLSLIREKVVSLSIKLNNENEVDSGLDLLGALLEIRRRNRRDAYDLWEYEQTLKEVVPEILVKEPAKVIDMLCDKLSEAIELEMSTRGISDVSYVWRPAIEDHPQNPDYADLKNLLVNAIRDNLERMRKLDEKSFKICYEILSRYDHAVFRRIEIHLMRLSQELFGKEIQNVLSDRRVFDEIHVWHEYFHLLKGQYAVLPQENKEMILKWIEEGPDLEEFELWYEKERGTKPTQAEKEARRSHWRLRYLSAIKETLPPGWEEKWRNLLTMFPEPEHPDFDVYMETGEVIPQPPLTKEEVMKKSPQDIVGYLRTWRPSNDRFGPSMEGLGTVLRQVVSEKPSHYTEISQNILQLEPIYVYSFIDGLLKATENGKCFDWKPVIRLCEGISLTYESARALDVGEESDYRRTVMLTVARLIEKGLTSKANLIPFELRKGVWRIIEILLQDNEPDLSYEEKYDLDPVTLSLNTVRGMSLYALFSYAYWCARSLNLSDKENRMVPEVREQLERMLDPEVEPTKTVRAAYGRFLANLFYLDKKWTLERIPSIFPDNADHRTLWIAAWEAYVIYSRFHDDIYRSIRRQYETAVNKLSSPKISNNAKEKLSEKLMVGYIRDWRG